MGTRWHSRRGTSTAMRRDIHKSFKIRWLHRGEGSRCGRDFIGLGRKVTSCVQTQPTKLGNPEDSLLRDFVEREDFVAGGWPGLVDAIAAVADAVALHDIEERHVATADSPG